MVIFQGHVCRRCFPLHKVHTTSLLWSTCPRTCWDSLAAESINVCTYPIYMTHSGSCDRVEGLWVLGPPSLLIKPKKRQKKTHTSSHWQSAHQRTTEPQPKVKRKGVRHHLKTEMPCLSSYFSPPSNIHRNKWKNQHL